MVDTGLEDPVAEAAHQQRLASDPTVSAFVSASAGSGKTKLLIDRLLRLMLPDPSRDRPPTPPERILCLTFTKAGAAEMAIRLRRVLGRWVTLDDAALDAELAALDLTPTALQREAARALFARILDVPGGLRIGTIHAFCEQLLRRFPLEASISPHFRLVEEHDTTASLDRAREHAVALADVAGHVASLAARLDASVHSELSRHLHAKADRLAAARVLDAGALAQTLARLLDVAHHDEDALVAHAVAAIPDELPDALRALTGKSTAKLLDWLSLPLETRAARWCEWRDLNLTREGRPRAALQSNPVTGRETWRVHDIEDQRRALAVIESTAALLAVCAPSLAAYEAEKRALGLLDFDDLIGRTRDLLANPGVAWVLFKLDGGLDHLLLDEVQDTSAAQWAIAGSLTEEFFAGAGAASAGRTIFAVGDFKQSIYAFQGADPLGFRQWRQVFGARARGGGAPFREPELTVSFRSSPAILNFVDAVFRHPLAAMGVAEPPHAVPAHRSAHPLLAGAVEIWPLVAPDQDDPPTSPWTPADRNRGLASGQLRLADALAEHLADLIARRELRPGDILVLFRRRTRFAAALMRALKARDVPVAGLDRMVLTEQPAVADLLALCDALLLPDDDLALATYLTSPLGGLDDPSLMDLALGRRFTLAEALYRRHTERPDWEAAHGLFARLLARVDFVSPHALLVEILGACGGRARLLARLGPEAAEAIDELLAASLAHAATRIPSMQGFVHWVRASGAEIKREPAEAADEVRLMTVHGSKGLEGRLVVLADTTVPPRNDDTILWPGDGPVPIWVPNKDLRCTQVERLRDLAARGAAEEENRLLYVALTRARQRLIICGWQPRGELDERTWYAHCRRAFDARDGEPTPDGRRLFVHVGDEPPDERTGAQPAAPPPDWAGTAPFWRARPPAPEAAGQRSLVPSRPEGVIFGPVPQATSPRARAGRAAGRRRGEILHDLLQHLPDLPDADRAHAARRFARRRLDQAEAERLVDEALAVLAHPLLARVLGPLGRAEQRLAGRVGGLAITGIVDRIAIGPDAIDLVDFKSGRAAPREVVRTPVHYLRQMSAYRGVLQALRPEVPITCLLVWTADAAVIALPDALLNAHAPALA